MILTYLQEVEVELISTTNLHGWNDDHNTRAALDKLVVEQRNGLQVVFRNLGNASELLGGSTEDLGDSIGEGSAHIVRKDTDKRGDREVEMEEHFSYLEYLTFLSAT